jgi:RND family efflux transporter MFP subunit
MDRQEGSYSMSQLLKWSIAMIVTAGLSALGVWAFLAGRQELAREREMDQPVKVPPRVARSADGQESITLDAQTQERIGLKTEVLAGASRQPQVLAYGTLQEDPAQAFVLRAPIAGTLRQTAQQKWPGIGAVLADGAAVGVVAPRFTSLDQVDLATKLLSAKSEVEATAASLVASRAEYQRLSVLNANGLGASVRAVQEAEAKVKGEEARLRGATETCKVIEAAMAAQAGPSGPVTLKVDYAGQVVELWARPGEAVEAGQTLLKLARFDQVLAAVTVPLGEKVDSSVSTARLVVAGSENQVLPAERVALAPTASSMTLGQTFLFRLTEGKLGLRPGMAVTAYLPATGHASKGVVMPRSAVIRYAGRAWAYVQQDDKFIRREVAVDEPAERGWLVTSGWQEGQRVVVSGAQVLLSEELKSQIQITQ